jgi:hypothetical protein
MTILAQCGFGRSDKIEQGLNLGIINGVIMSPRDERRERLEQTINDWGMNYPNALIAFDPQFYAATLNAPRDGHLSEYDYYQANSGLGRTHFSGTLIRKYAKECIDYQNRSFGKNVTYLISPTILFDSFRDSWSQISLNMAVESVDYHSTLENPRPLLLSLVISETAFQNMEALEEILDALTELKTEGFYIIIRRNATSLQHAMEASAFGRFMYFCHVLADINEYKVIVGYSDWHSFMLKTAGVAYTASGWYQNLRQFSFSRFQPSAGGRRPRKRYSSLPMLSCPLITPELQDIFLEDLLPYVLSGSQYDSILNVTNGPSSGEPNWSDEISCLTHWFSLGTLSRKIETQTNHASKIQEAERLINNALVLYARLERRGIAFDPSTGPNHIHEWQDSMQEYKSLVRI